MVGELLKCVGHVEGVSGDCREQGEVRPLYMPRQRGSFPGSFAELAADKWDPSTSRFLTPREFSLSLLKTQKVLHSTSTRLAPKNCVHSIWPGNGALKRIGTRNYTEILHWPPAWPLASPQAACGWLPISKLFRGLGYLYLCLGPCCIPRPYTESTMAQSVP